jgi:ribosomal protein S18 acetylase RimI-like enzyme
MNIRLLGPEDRGAILEIYNELKLDYPFPLGADWTDEKLRKELVAAKGYGYYSDDKSMQAFLIYRVAPEVREITLLATRKSAQNQGIMGRLLEHFLKNSCLQTGGLKVWLEVHAANTPAKALYLRSGFNEQGIRRAYYKDGGDAILLEYNPLQ